MCLSTNLMTRNHRQKTSDAQTTPFYACLWVCVACACLLHAQHATGAGGCGSVCLPLEALGLKVAPFYDVTFSPNAFGEHATAFLGFGKQPTLHAIQQLAVTANFAKWSHARQVIEEVVSAFSDFSQQAAKLGVNKKTVKLMQRQLNTAYENNKHLLVG